MKDFLLMILGGVVWWGGTAVVIIGARHLCPGFWWMPLTVLAYVALGNLINRIGR